jgi:hypothetical protein
VLLFVLKVRGKYSADVPMEEDEELPENGEYTPVLRNGGRSSPKDP